MSIVGGSVMSTTVNEQAILEALHRLSPDRWGDVLAFIQSLGPAEGPAPEREKRPLTADALLASGLVGLWSDRADIGDSREFARRLREQSQTRGRGWSCWIPTSRSTSSGASLPPSHGSRDSELQSSSCRDWS
jgi:hypothetical protein